MPEIFKARADEKEDILSQEAEPELTPYLAGLKEYIASLNGMYGEITNLYFNGMSEKGQNKIQNDLESYAKKEAGETVIFCYDSTLFGGATDGFLATDRKIYFHKIWMKKMPPIPYGSIKYVVYEKQETLTFYDLRIYYEATEQSFIDLPLSAKEDEASSVVMLIRKLCDDFKN